MAENFFFAYVDEADAFNASVHNVEDEDVFSFSLTQQEGDFAQLTVTIKNPRVGLLAPGRKLWVWFSWDQALPGDSPDIVPLFHGRLVGLPDNLFDQTVDLVFTAQPSNFAAQKTTLANTMRVLPYWDPIFITPDSWIDDDTVLEARSELWHIDPVTLTLTSSDILVGDSLVEFQEDEFFYDSMQISLQSSPASSVTMQATIPWLQSGQGDLDLSESIRAAFNPSFDPTYQMIASFSFPGLSSGWPKSGSKIGDGWVVTNGDLTDEAFLAVPQMKFISIFDTTTEPTPVAVGSILFPAVYSGTVYGGVDGASISETIDWLIAPIGWGYPELQVQYTRSAQFGQVVTFTLEAHMQNILTDDDSNETIALTLNANPVSDITYDDSIPIGDVLNRDYVHSDRGLQSIEYLVLYARAHLLARARAIQIQFQTDMRRGFAATLRKSGLIHDERLPGLAASGKFTTYSFDLDGDQGAPIATLTIASAIGYGGSVAGSDGTGVYANAGYMVPNYQAMSGTISVVDTSDIQFQVPDVERFDDGINFTAGLSPAEAIISLSVANTAQEQKTTLLAAAGKIPDQAAVQTVLQSIPTQVTMLLRPMGQGPYTQEVALALSDLIVPQQINLEADSS